MAIDPETVLVAIPALDEEHSIEACIRSLMQDELRSLMQDDLRSLMQDDPTEAARVASGGRAGSVARAMSSVRIVVADGGSRDATRRVVGRLAREYANVSLIDNPERLQSAGINRIVATSTDPGHRILVRCDAHAVYPPGYALRVADELQRHGAAALVVPMDAIGRGGFAGAAAWIVDTPLGSGGAAHRGGRRSGWVEHGHHAGIRLDWFRRIGGYDPSFSHNEDGEFDMRLARAGGRIWLDADIRIEYRMRETLRDLSRQYWRYGRGRARTVTKHRARPRLRQILPAINVAGLAACLAMAPIWSGFLAGPVAYAGLLSATSLVAMARTGSAWGLYAGPALAAIHLPWGTGFLVGVAGGSAADVRSAGAARRA